MDDVIVCGRLLGTATDLDQFTDQSEIYYTLNAVPEAGIPVGNTFVDYKNGIIHQKNFKGETIFIADIVEVVSKLPRIKNISEFK